MEESKLFETMEERMDLDFSIFMNDLIDSRNSRIFS